MNPFSQPVIFLFSHLPRQLSTCTVTLFCSRSSSSISDNLNKRKKMFETCKHTFTPVAYFTKSCSGTGSKKNVTRFEQEHVQNSVQKVLENRRKNERELGPRREFPFDPVPTRFSLRQSSGSRVYKVCISEHHCFIQWMETNPLDSVNHLLTKASPLSLLPDTHFRINDGRH